MGIIYNKPWNKDPVINQPVFQWKVGDPGFFDRGSFHFLTISNLFSVRPGGVKGDLLVQSTFTSQRRNRWLADQWSHLTVHPLQLSGCLSLWPDSFTNKNLQWYPQEKTPIGFMGLVYLPTFTIKINQMEVNILVPWILWARTQTNNCGFQLPLKQLPICKEEPAGLFHVSIFQVVSDGGVEKNHILPTHQGKIQTKLLQLIW